MGGFLQAKTGVEGPEQAEMVRGMVQEYVRGLCWVMRYYYDGAFSPPPDLLCSKMPQDWILNASVKVVGGFGGKPLKRPFHIGALRVSHKTP